MWVAIGKGSNLSRGEQTLKVKSVTGKSTSDSTLRSKRVATKQPKRKVISFDCSYVDNRKYVLVGK